MKSFMCARMLPSCFTSVSRNAISISDEHSTRWTIHRRYSEPRIHNELQWSVYECVQHFNRRYCTPNPQWKLADAHKRNIKSMATQTITPQKLRCLITFAVACFVRISVIYNGLIGHLLVDQLKIIQEHGVAMQDISNYFILSYCRRKMVWSPISTNSKSIATKRDSRHKRP